jgi:hypothetical protein
MGALSSAGQHHLYTARDSRLNRLRAFYSTVTHASTNHARLLVTWEFKKKNAFFYLYIALLICDLISLSLCLFAFEN